MTVSHGSAGGWDALSVDLDPPNGVWSRLGLIVLADDTTIEGEIHTFLAGLGVAIHVNRIPKAGPGSLSGLADMEDHLGKAVATLAPSADLDVIAFGCTSGTMVIGAERIESRVRAARSNSYFTTPATACIKGLRTLGCRKIALLTPYTDQINGTVENYFASQGFEIVAKAGFKQAGDDRIARIPPEAVCRAAVDLAGHGVDGVMISCTALRVSPVIEEIERLGGAPVVTSNQALAWDCLRLAGRDERAEGYGRLLRM